MAARKETEKVKKRLVGWGAAALILLVCLLLTLFPRPGGSWPAVFSALRLSEERIPATPVITFLDVGQGDATLLRDGAHAVLIDGGTDGAGLVRQLRRLGVGRLDMIVATHPHSDHIGGLDLAAEAFSAQRVLLSDLPPADEADSLCYQRLLALAADGQTVLLHPKDGEEYDAGDIHLQFFAPTPQAGEENDRSLVLLADVGGAAVLVTGDAGREEEMALLAAGRPLDADLLKVGHHGSGTSSSPAFLQAVSPAYAVISVGVDNTYGHPSPETLARLQDVGAAICRTDTEGSVAFRVIEGRLDRLYE